MPRVNRETKEYKARIRNYWYYLAYEIYECATNDEYVSASRLAEKLHMSGGMALNNYLIRHGKELKARYGGLPMAKCHSSLLKSFMVPDEE